MKVEIVLDESQFGNIKQDDSLPFFGFFQIHKDGDEEFITARYCDGTKLIAVSKVQYKQWKSYNIISKVVE